MKEFPYCVTRTIQKPSGVILSVKGPRSEIQNCWTRCLEICAKNLKEWIQCHENVLKYRERNKQNPCAAEAKAKAIKQPFQPPAAAPWHAQHPADQAASSTQPPAAAPWPWHAQHPAAAAPWHAPAWHAPPAAPATFEQAQWFAQQQAMHSQMWFQHAPPMPKAPSPREQIGESSSVRDRIDYFETNSESLKKRFSNLKTKNREEDPKSAETEVRAEVRLKSVTREESPKSAETEVQAEVITKKQTKPSSPRIQGELSDSDSEVRIQGELSDSDSEVPPRAKEPRKLSDSDSDSEVPSRAKKEPRKSLSDGDIPKVRLIERSKCPWDQHRTSRRIQVWSFGSNFCGLEEPVAKKSSLSSEVRKKMESSFRSLGYDFPYSPADVWLNAGMFKLKTVPADHCGLHFSTVKAMSQDDFFNEVLSHLKKTLPKDALKRNRKEEPVNIVCVDDTGCSRSVALAFLVAGFLRRSGYVIRRTIHVHKKFWPCGGACESCGRENDENQKALFDAHKRFAEARPQQSSSKA